MERTDLTRRAFLGAAGASVTAAAAPAALAADGSKIRILGIATSLRKGKTTAASIGVCLEAARAVDPRVETELIDVADLSIPPQPAAGIPLPAGAKDDFPALAERLSAPEVRGIILGTPVYFGNMSSLCKALLERCIVMRKGGFRLAGKVAGVLAVGGGRNGGQELTLRSVQTALMCQEMVVVGDGRPSAHFGATLWSGAGEALADDTFGMGTARNLGRHVAEVALRLA